LPRNTLRRAIRKFHKPLDNTKNMMYGSGVQQKIPLHSVPAAVLKKGAVREGMQPEGTARPAQYGTVADTVRGNSRQLN